ncbi:uncharacterized protein LOC141626598 isoform X2 [Silene latifolia]|uniref:uncharacterized protein LOC141626598 isoform X2 n=1 Tax=Silene latifolia TaxID=37657 RepID=UPI003D77C2C2
MLQICAIRTELWWRLSGGRTKRKGFCAFTRVLFILHSLKSLLEAAPKAFLEAPPPCLYFIACAAGIMVSHALSYFSELARLSHRSNLSILFGNWSWRITASVSFGSLEAEASKLRDLLSIITWRKNSES